MIAGVAETVVWVVAARQRRLKAAAALAACWVLPPAPAA